MKRFVRFVLLFSAIVGASLLWSGNAAAVTGVSWLEGRAALVQPLRAAELSYATTTCSGDMSLISLEGWAVLREACVFGYSGGTQVARYVGSSGLYLYAIKFPLDAKFTPIKGLCLHASSCVYGQASDTFLMQQQQSNGFSTALIPDFTQHLVKYNDEGTYFRFEYEGELQYISYGTQSARTIAAAVSSNGRWAIVEVRTYGYVRINLETLEQKRVVAPGVEYGYGTDPTIELAISDDGTKVAIAGSRMSIAVYEVDQLCGDVLTDTSTMYHSPYTYACSAASIDVYSLFPGFTSAHAPRFSHDGSRLSLYVYAANKVKKATIAPEASVAMSTSSYLAFGDSFTSGEGELSDDFYLPETNTNTNRCHVSTRSYPYLLKQRWGGAVSNMACSGSRIAQVNQTSAAASVQMEPADRPMRISIGIGGNDIDLMGKLKTCIGPGTCEWATEKKRSVGKAEIHALFPDLVAMLQEMQKNYPGTDIAVIGYPSVVNTSSSSSCRPLVSALLNSDERLFMEESIKYLNVVLKAAAIFTKITYVDTKNALVGERLCDSTEAAMNSVRLGDDIAPIPLLTTVKLIGAESFHPTPRGHELITTTIQDMMAGAWWTSDDCAFCEFDESQLAASSYWDVASETGVPPRQKSSSFLLNSNIKSGTLVPFRFSPGSFAPGAAVAFSLHSEPQGLVTQTADANGGLSGELQMPDDMEGYHTVHATGLLPSGEPVDVYEVVALLGAGSPVVEPGSVYPSTSGGESPAHHINENVVTSTSIVPQLELVANDDALAGGAFTIPVVASNEALSRGGSDPGVIRTVPEPVRQLGAIKTDSVPESTVTGLLHSYILLAVGGIGAIVSALLVMIILRKWKQPQTIEVKRQ